MKTVGACLMSVLLLGFSTSAWARLTDNGGSIAFHKMRQYCTVNFPLLCGLKGYEDWYRMGSYCIKHFNTSLNFSDAEFFCRGKAPGGHLVSVHNEKGNSDLLCVTMKYSPVSPRIWLGAMELFRSNKFVWLDGSSWNFQKWVPGQPDNTADKEDCVEMNWKTSGSWNDDRCHLKKNMVCSFKNRV